MGGRGSTGNVIAALASFFLPGLGHLLQGRLLGGLFWFLLVGVAYGSATLLPPLVAVAVVLHVFCIYGAATYRPVG